MWSSVQTHSAERIRSVPGKSVLPVRSSAMMQPTDQISTGSPEHTNRSTQASVAILLSMWFFFLNVIFWNGAWWKRSPYLFLFKMILVWSALDVHCEGDHCRGNCMLYIKASSIVGATGCNFGHPGSDSPRLDIWPWHQQSLESWLKPKLIWIHLQGIIYARQPMYASLCMPSRVLAVLMTQPVPNSVVPRLLYMAWTYAICPECEPGSTHRITIWAGSDLRLSRPDLLMHPGLIAWHNFQFNHGRRN